MDTSSMQLPFLIHTLYFFASFEMLWIYISISPHVFTYPDPLKYISIKALNFSRLASYAKTLLLNGYSESIENIFCEVGSTLAKAKTAEGYM